MRAHVLNGILLLVALSGIAAWIGTDLGSHAATSAAFLLAILWHMKRADRTVQRRGGMFAGVCVLIVAGLGLGTGDLAVLLHAAFAFMLVGAGVMMHVRAVGRPGDFLDAVALALSVWLLLRVADLLV